MALTLSNMPAGLSYILKCFSFTFNITPRLEWHSFIMAQFIRSLDDVIITEFDCILNKPNNT